MRNKITTVFALVAGFLGGVLSHYLFLPATVQAQAQAPTEIRARKFVLVDENGTPRGVFGFQSNGNPEIQVRFDKPKGILKLVSAEVGTVRWMGVALEKNVLPDLKVAPPAKANPPSGSE